MGKGLCKFFCIFTFFAGVMLSVCAMNVQASTDTLNIESPSALLMELESGQILYEKDAETARRPASVTKIMTMLLAFDAVDSGKIKMDDMVSVSGNAASMGGSQVYL